MKQLIFNTTVILISIFTFYSNVFSQGNWEQILPSGPTSNQMVSLYFVDENTGWSAGEHGTILKTTNGAKSWRLIEIPWLTYLLDIFFVNEMTGYSVGQDGLILKSTDGGENWSRLDNQYTNNLHRVIFLDENTGWTIGEKGLILHTKNGGENWVQQLSYVGEDLHGISFIGTNNLCVVGENFTLLKLKIADGTWHAINFEPDAENQDEIYHFYDVYFLDQTHGWIGGAKELYGSVILYTTNRGDFWREKETKYGEYTDHSSHGRSRSGISFPLQQILFIDGQNGFILTHPNGYLTTSSNVPFFTKDGGKKWLCEMYGSGEGSTRFGRMCCLSDSKVINTGFQGEFRFAENDFKKWRYPNALQRNFFGLYVGNNGLLFSRQRREGAEFPEDERVFTRSTDYGKSWQEFTPLYFDSTGSQFAPEYPSTFLLYREKDQTLWKHIYHTLEEPLTAALHESKDLGLTWQFIRSGLTDYFEHVLSPDTLIQFRLHQVEIEPENYHSRIKFSNSFDGGRTKNIYYFNGIWNEIVVSHTKIYENRFISDNYFFDGKTGFLIGSEGNIIKTEDTGQSWKAINSGVVEHLWDIEFLNRSIGFIVGDFGRILKSIDGGESWRKTNSGTQENIYSIAFKNELEGWVGTESGMMYTTDGGENWQGVPLRYQHGFVRQIQFDKNGNGYASNLRKNTTTSYFPYKRLFGSSGGYSFLLSWKNNESQVVDIAGGVAFPQTIILKQNYPNPFNNSTKIRYTLNKPGNVTLKIFNLQGQLVKKLGEKSQKAGEHSILWDGRSGKGEKITSGVYIYSIEVNKIIQTKKMLYLQ
jgi:photosystem II stability/assembly factor-like uncharacterized protein